MIAHCRSNIKRMSEHLSVRSDFAVNRADLSNKVCAISSNVVATILQPKARRIYKAVIV